MKHMKPNSLKTNVTAYKLWAAFMRKKGINYKTATTDDAFHFWDYLKSREGINGEIAAPGTVHTYIKIMKKHYKILVAEGIVKANIFETGLIRLEHPKSKMKRRTKLITMSEVKRFLKHKPMDMKERQALFAASLMYGGGLRISEVVKLKFDDIKYTEKDTLYLYLRAPKGGLDEFQPLPAWCKPLLTKQLGQRNRDNLGDNLFVSYRKSGRILRPQINERSMSRHTKRIFNLLNIDGTNHSFRKAAINRVIQEHSVEGAQEFARHKTIIATQQYKDVAVNLDNNLALKISN